MSAIQTAPPGRIEAEPAASDFRSLDAAIAGAVVGPADPGWDGVRQAWNLAVDQRPAAVALPQTADDVVAIVDFAREHGLRIAPQGTGHNAAPLEHQLTRSILVKTERMRAVEIDVQNQRARAEAGALWMDVTVPAGTTATVLVPVDPSHPVASQGHGFQEFQGDHAVYDIGSGSYSFESQLPA